MGVEGVEVFLLVLCFEETGEEVTGYDLGLGDVSFGRTRGQTAVDVPTHLCRYLRPGLLEGV